MIENIERQLGQIEGKQNAMCVALNRIEKKLNNLPCEAHINAMHSRANKNVSWKVFVVAIGLMFALICGSFTYTYEINKNVRAMEIKEQLFKSDTRMVNNK